MYQLMDYLCILLLLYYVTVIHVDLPIMPDFVTPFCDFAHFPLIMRLFKF